MPTGKVKWFSARKGYGFITPDGEEDEGNDVFVHYTGIVTEKDEFRTLNEGDEVEFEVGEGQKGPEAKNVKVTKHAPRRPRRGYGQDQFED
ncbi:MAG: cold-shock protein [Promethearchaeota archaeon]